MMSLGTTAAAAAFNVSTHTVTESKVLENGEWRVGSGEWRKMEDEEWLIYALRG